MHKRIIRKKIRKYFYSISVVAVLVFGVFIFLPKEHMFVTSVVAEEIIINDDGHKFVLRSVQGGTVVGILDSIGIELSDGDRVFPNRESQIFSEDVINIERKKALGVIVDGEEMLLETYGEKVGELLARNGIEFDDNDLVVPEINGVIWQDADVEIVRVEYKEEVKIENIVFETILKKDDEISFLKKFTKQDGRNGKKELKYKVAYHNGKEVDRELVDESIVKEPIDEIIVQGTQVKLGKKHTGACSWYAYTGTMSAAHKWLPKGSYVKVTNKANGKSVIVQINDRGPFVPGRIIDLDKVAFAKIASIGAGVIDVKMEEIIE